MKKFTCMLLIIVILVITSSCSAPSSEKSSTTPSSSPQASAPAETKETNTKDEVDPAFAPFEETVTVKAVKGYSESSRPGYRPSTSYWNTMLKDYLNIKIDYLWEVPTEQYNTKLSTTLASGNYPDMLSCDFQTYNYLKEASALADLKEVWEKYASKPIKNSLVGLKEDPLGKCTEDGKLYAIPYAVDPAERMSVIYYRTDWLKNVGLEKPASLDDFTEVMKAFHEKDPDKNGKNDTYGLAMNMFPSGNPVFASHNAYPGKWIMKDNKVVSGTVQPETKEALDYLRKLYTEGYIDTEFATLDSTQMNTRIADNKVGILPSQWYAGDSEHVQQSFYNCETTEWEAQPIVSKEAGVPAKVSMNENAINGYNVVFSTASEEARIAMIKFLNIFYDYNFINPVEDGGSGNKYWDQSYPTDSKEYKEIEKQWYSWWLPVTIWDPIAVYKQCKALTKLYETGEFDPFISKGNEEANIRWKKWAEYAKLDRKDMKTEEDLEWWVKSRTVALMSRLDTENTECAFTIVTRLKDDGNVVLNVFYGPETETGNAVASTLSDMTDEYFNRYIMGMESEESWETFVTNWNQAGGERWTQEVNEAYTAIH